MNDDGPKTLVEAVQYFADNDVCRAYMEAIKWPRGNVACPKCGSERIGRIETRKLYKCRACKKQFSAKTDTIFEDSPLPLSHWFVAVWQIANCKNGVSSLELHRALGVTQKTAWFMLHRIRLAMRSGTFRKFGGPVESDETYVGGRAENMHQRERAKRITGRGGVGKAIVHGLLQRGTDQQCSQVRAEVIPVADQDTLGERMAVNVERGATVYTDAAASYSNLRMRYVHDFVDHATRYARGIVHVNGLENFWSLLKRSIRGTYVAVAAFHLQRYIDAQAWRFNRRAFHARAKHGDGADRLPASVLGRDRPKRLRLRVLTPELHDTRGHA